MRLCPEGVPWLDWENKMKIPRVGLAVIVMKDSNVLLGKRKMPNDAGTWCFPGGRLEYFESFKNCALRETLEESGLKIELIDKNPVAITNDFFIEDDSHYITLFLRGKYVSGEPKVMEPDKCEEWRWYKWNNLPKKLMLPIRNLLKQDYNPFI